MCLHAHVACFSEAEFSDLALGSGCTIHLPGTSATPACPKLHHENEALWFHQSRRSRAFGFVIAE
jgi:hypothetical protein